MRVLKLFLYLFVLSFAAYSGLWYYQGHTNLNQMQSWLESPSKKLGIQKIQFESIALKGYPFRVKIEIQKPKMTLTPMSWFGSSFPGFSTPEYAELQSLVTELSVTDKIIIESDVLGYQHTLEVKGDVQIKGLDKKQSLLDMLYKAKILRATFTSNAEMLKKGLVNFERLSKHDWKTQPIPVKDIHVITEDLQNFDPKTGKHLSTIGESSEKYSLHKQADNAYVFNAKLSYKKIEFAESDNAKNPNSQGQISLDLYDLSPVDLFITVDYEGKAKFQDILNSETPLKAKTSFELYSKLMQTKQNGEVEVSFKNGQPQSVKVDFNGNSKFEAGFHKVLSGAIKSSAQEILASLEAEGELEATEKASLQFNIDNAEKIAPKLDELGVIENKFLLEANMSANGPEATLQEASFKNKLYLIMLNGEATMHPQQQIKMSLLLNSWQQLMNRIDPYAQLMNRFANETGQPELALPDNFMTKFRSFVRGLDPNPASKENLNIPIQYLNHQVIIGNQPIEKVMQKWSDLFPAPQKQSPNATPEGTEAPTEPSAPIEPIELNTPE